MASYDEDDRMDGPFRADVERVLNGEHSILRAAERLLDLSKDTVGNSPREMWLAE
jgi:hypothetical protein